MTAPGRHLPLYLSPPHPCSYLPDRQSSTLFADPEQPMDMATYSELLRYGFRRSGGLVYAPRCEYCSQCLSLRVPVAGFTPRRSQRRVWQTNRDIRVRERPAGFDPDHYALYQRYTRKRHEDGEMADASADDYRRFLCADWCDTRFLEFRLGNRLVAVAVTDVPDEALSAVYTFFDPELAARSLGTLAILTQIERARERGLRHVYLGYWIGASRKMAYKGNFRPLELWREGQWQYYDSDDRLPDQDAA